MRRLTHGTERRGRRPLRASALLILLIVLLAVPATAGAAAPGGFNQLPNPLGCLSNDGSGGTCIDAHDLGSIYDMAISPDGRDLYASGNFSGTIVAFSRNASTGALTQKAGQEGCVANGASTSQCRGVTNMNDPLGLAITPNGRTLYVAVFSQDRVLSFTRDPATGNLSQKAGALGCISNTGNGVTCRDARAMDGPYYLSVTADGKNLYVAAFDNDSVDALAIDGSGNLSQVGDGSGGSGCVENIPADHPADSCADGRALDGPFAMNVDPVGLTIYPAAYNGASVSALARDPATGRLSPVSGATGCVDDNGDDGCTTVSDLSTIRDLTGAPGNKQLYVAVEGTSRVLTFDRLDSGGLVRKTGDAGCVSNGAVAGCKTGRALEQPAGIAASADGNDVYVASQSAGSGLVELDRASNGVLTPRADTAGCAASSSAPTNCQTLAGIGSNGLYDVKLSPDGRFIYVSNTSFDTIGVLRRDSSGPVCTDGNQTVTQGTLTTLKLPCTDPDGDPVSFQIVNPPTIGGLGLIDEGHDQVGYAASQGQCGTTAFTFRGTSSGQTSPNRTFTLNVVGCGGGGGGGTTPPPPLKVQSTTASFDTLAFSKYTKFVNLSANHLPNGSTVTVTCKTKKKKQQKKGCPYKRKSFKNGSRATLNLRKPFRNRRVPVKTKIAITISAAGFIDKRITYTIRKGKRPKGLVQCVPPGGKAADCRKFG
jgi:6-phosphogluconolactonase (cycloisomerase 2 family)